nr:ATP-binding cassette domain-containing protein [Campylobacter sp.]
MQNIIEAKNVSICYEKGLNIINNANFAIKNKDFVFITGKSGSGKSTLIKSMYGAIGLNGGEMKVCMNNLSNISRSKLTALRQKLGLIFQDFRLINEWSVERNIMLPLLIKGYNISVCQKQVSKLLKHVNLLHKSDKFPLELSGGEQQRVAVARALAHNPQILLCDEPTGSLDEYSSDIIWSLLRSARDGLGTCVVVVTHKIPSGIRLPYRHFEIVNGGIHEIP